jgi:hypothetical protein
MNNKPITLMVCLMLVLSVFITSCTTEKTERADIDVTDEKTISLGQNSYDKDANKISNSFIEFVMPDGWSIVNRNESNISMSLMNEDSGISGVTIQFIDTGGIMNAKQYIDTTARGASNPQQLNTRDPNPSNVVFQELIATISGSDSQTQLWQYVTNTEDGNIVLISVTGVPENTQELDSLLDSIKVLR